MRADCRRSAVKAGDLVMGRPVDGEESESPQSSTFESKAWKEASQAEEEECVQVPIVMQMRVCLHFDLFLNKAAVCATSY